jgi:hypothetical protein
MHSRLEDLSVVDWCEAAFRLCCLPGAGFEDWLLCLRRQGLPAETGACKLYAITKRPRRDDTIDSLVLDHDDWREYLRHEKFLA